jgi:hypothetical protein
MSNATRRILGIALVVLGGLLGAPPRKAAADIPLATSNTSVQIQNLSTSPAGCRYDIYAPSGGAPIFSHVIASTIPVGGSILVYTGSPAHGGSSIPMGVNAGVVQCDQDVAAVVVFQNAVKRDAYVATAAPASTMYVPAVYKNYFNFTSSMRLQNTAATSQIVQVSYYEPGSPVPSATRNATLSAHGSVTLDQAAVSELKSGVSYSAKIVGGAPLAVTVAIVGQPGSSVESHLYAYSGFASGATRVYTPMAMKNYYGFNTSTSVLNIGTVVASVTRTFSNGAVDTYTIQPNSSAVMLDFQNPKLPGGNTVYASTIESTNGQPLVVLVNQSTPYNRATASEGLTAADGGTTIVLPSVVKRFYGYNSSITCQNISSTSTSLRVTYSNSAVVNKQVITNLAPNGVAGIYQPSEAGLPNGYSGSAEISSDQPVVCLVTQDQNEAPMGNHTNDTFAGYNGIVKHGAALPSRNTLRVPGIWRTP